WKNVIERRGFALKDLQVAQQEGFLQCSQQEVLQNILVLTRDGAIESGANAYLFVARRIWWAWPFYAIFRLPGVNWILWGGYRWFNRNRYRISRHCPLPSQASSPHVSEKSTDFHRGS
ncbi:MAG: DCC1-like thiol-disulfide oxidoreductase family protein, partial [Candidatus Acidiferrum sp.]